MNLNEDETLLDAWRQQVKDRHTSALSANAPTGAGEATDPGKICSVVQLQEWAKNDPQAVLDIVNQHRRWLDKDKLYIQTLDEEHRRLSEDQHKASKALNAKLAETKASLKHTKALLKDARDTIHHLSEDHKEEGESIGSAQSRAHHHPLINYAPAAIGGLSNNLTTFKTAILPDPPLFSGNESEYADAYRLWKRKMQDKLEFDSEVFHSNEERIAYFLSRLDRPAALAAVSDRSTYDVETIGGLFDYLDNVYGEKSVSGSLKWP